MSVQYCFKCDSYIDTDYEAEHFYEGECQIYDDDGNEIDKQSES